jgi:predicted RNA-binding protein (virulence factor B family)
LILNHFGVSKKVFKRAIGGLLKQGKIKQTAKGIVRM